MAAVIGFFRSSVLDQDRPPGVAVIALLGATVGLFLLAGRLLARLDDVLDEYW